MKKILKIVFVIIGTLIGAGFASGQEIYLFFFSYGIKGILGLLISSLLISLVIYKILKIVKERKIENYRQLLDILIQPKRSNKKYMNIQNVTNNIVNIFVLVTFFIMIAGFGAYFEEQLCINHIIGSSLLAIICFFVFRKNIQGVVKVNEIIIPFLIIFIILIGSLTIKDTIMNIEDFNFNITKKGFFLSSILYAGYNSILLIPVLITLKNFLEEKKQILKISILTGIITIVLGTIVFGILFNVGDKVSQIEMPIAYVVSKLITPFQIIYGLVIMLSIFTTAVSLGNSFLESISKRNILNTAFICISSVIFSNFGFSNLITYVYPLFGVLGLVQIIEILKCRNKAN